MAGFAGKWIDSVVAGDMENFDNFVKAVGMEEKEIEGYRGYKATQTTTVDGDDWSYAYEFGKNSMTHCFKMNCKNPEDTDMEGNKFVMTTTLDKNNPKRMVELTVTKKGGKDVTTETVRTLNEAGDRQAFVITHMESGVSMKGEMIKLQTV